MKAILNIVLFLPVFSFAQTETFSQEALVAVIKKYHPVVKQAELNERIASADIRTAQGLFDPLLSISNNAKDFYGIKYYDQELTEIKIPAWYGIDLVAGKEVMSGNYLNPQETKGTVNYVGFSVPVLQNLLMDKRRASLKQARIFKDLSEVQKRAVVNDLLYEALKSYMDWWQCYQTYQLLQSASSNAEKRFAMVKTYYTLGDRPAIDTLEALTQVQTFAIKQIESFTALTKAKLELSTYLWKEGDQQYNLPDKVAPEHNNLYSVLPIEELLKQTSSHPEALQYGFKLKALEIEKRLKFQMLLPQLNFKYNQLGKSLSETVKDPWFQNNYRFGFSFSIPLRLSQGRGEYQKVKLKLDQTKLEQLNKQVQLHNKVHQYYLEWQQTNTQLSVQKQLTLNTSLLQRGEETKFLNGESSLFLINARELKTLETEQKLIELQFKNNKALIAVRWAAGTLL